MPLSSVRVVAGEDLRVEALPHCLLSVCERGVRNLTSVCPSVIVLPGGILEFSWNLKALEGHPPWKFSDWILRGHGVPPRRLVGAGDGSLQPGYTILVVCLLTDVSGASCLDLVLVQ